MARKSISRKLRFEVFKRDGFTCQYCGRSAPNVVLEVDHIKPVAKGGGNELLNLVTSCFECNRGKGKRELNDDSIVKTQQEQLKELNEKRNQIAMMLEWREELKQLENEKVDILINEMCSCWGIQINLTQTGMHIVKNWLKEFDMNIILESIEIATKYYQKNGVEVAFKKIGGICYNKKNANINPVNAQRSKVYHFCKNKYDSIDVEIMWSLLNTYLLTDEDYQVFVELANDARSFSIFVYTVQEFFEE